MYLTLANFFLKYMFKYMFKVLWIYFLLILILITGQDLIKDLKSELSGNMEELILALFMPQTYYDAWSLRHAMKVWVDFKNIRCKYKSSEIKMIVNFHLDKNYVNFFSKS